MPHSSVAIVGRLTPGDATTWGDALLVPRARAMLLLDFQTLAARALGVRHDRISLHTKWQSSDMDNATRNPGRWHLDSYGGPAHVISTVGERPTQFLLGEIPAPYAAADLRRMRELSEFADLERQLRLWQPELGEVILVNRWTLHRRPLLRREPRLFLVGALC